MIKVLFTAGSLLNGDVEMLRQRGIDIINAPGNLSEDDLIRELKGCHGYIIGGTDKATKKVIESTDLRIIIFYGTGYESYVDVKTASERGVIVANTPKANAYTVAEHTVALILDVVKGVTWLNNSTKNGEWIRRITWNLQNKTLGIVGLGTIGTYVATILKNGFGMNIIYTSRSRKIETEKNLGAKKVDLDELFTQADVISIHTAYNQELEGMIGERQFNLMKKNAVLIDSTRAEIVDPKALKEALENGKLATAALDSYYKEPVPMKENDSWGLLSLSDTKFIITPHTGYGSEEAFRNMNNMVIANLTAFSEGKKVPYSVN